MPSKLKFKGEKRKRKTTEEDVAPVKDLKVDHEDEDGWMTAKSLDMLKGPVMLINPYPLACLSANDDGELSVSSKLDKVGDDELDVEPTSTRQVFVLTPLNFDGDSHNRYAFKSNAGYLSVKDNALDARSQAVGAYETFELDYTKDGWALLNNGKYVQFGREDGRHILNTIDELSDIKIILRVQTKFGREKARAEMAAKVLKQRITTRELEEMVDRRLSDHEVRVLKRAYKDGKFNEALLDVRQGSRHDSRC